MNILQKKQENVSANITNVNTIGYKFQDMVQSTLESKEMLNYTDGRKKNIENRLGGFVYGNQLDQVYTDFRQASLIQTDKMTDFAIIDRGFFVIEMPNGQYGYTRNGNFKVNNEGLLTTLDGYPVMGIDEDNQLQEILVENNQVDIDNTGYLPQQGLYMLLVDFENYENLQSVGNTIFTNEAEAFNKIDGQVRQAYVEASNVQIADELIKMIEISREFESNQKLLHTADETLNKAVNELGRL